MKARFPTVLGEDADLISGCQGTGACASRACLHVTSGHVLEAGAVDSDLERGPHLAQTPPLTLLLRILRCRRSPARGRRGPHRQNPLRAHLSLLALLKICSLEPWKDVVRILGVRRYRVFQVFLDPFADAILLLLAYTGLPYTAEAEHKVKRTLKFARGSITWAPRFSRKAVRVLASVHRGR